MSKHTPGPWYPPHFLDDETKCNCGHIFGEHQDNMGSICTIRWADGFDAQTKEVAEANARLIAAAPELLEALEDLISSLEITWRNGFAAVEDVQKELEFARTAISKAKGEA